MRKPVKVILWIVGIFFAIIALTVAIAFWATSPERVAQKQARHAAEAEFAAEFEFLSEGYFEALLETLDWFSNPRCNPQRRQWTITVATHKWYSMSPDERRDIAGYIWKAAMNTVARAGGDPTEARLILEDKWGKRLAICSDFYGVKIEK